MGWLVCVCLLGPWAAQAGPAEAWDLWQRRVRDGQIERAAAGGEIERLHLALGQAYSGMPAEGCAYPLDRDGPADIGGKRGDGYQPRGYDFLDGNRHQGHPAHDLFIDDRNQDGLRDRTGKPAAVLAHRPGVVVGVEDGWMPGSDQRGGNYVWVHTPGRGLYCYYAHLDRVSVTVGEAVLAGAVLGTLGRSGKNAARKASPTHLHLMCLAHEKGALRPVDPYADLLRCRTSSPPGEVTGAPSAPAAPGPPPAEPRRVIGDVPMPPGFARHPQPEGSFGAYLRALPLLPPGTPVRLHDGQPKQNQAAHFAVLDLPIGKRDLEQCADAVIRLRADYLWASGQPGRISFRFVSGFLADYPTWAAGQRIQVQGNRVRWVKSAAPSRDEKSFRAYLDVVFTYANTSSLEKQLDKVADQASPEIGDVFIQGGFPGHAVLVVDRAQAGDGRVIFLLAQSYMPAQQIHLLNSPAPLSPWYLPPRGVALVTPEWTFPPGALRRFPAR